MISPEGPVDQVTDISSCPSRADPLDSVLKHKRLRILGIPDTWSK